VARGSGVTLQAVEGELRDTSLSERLSRYPEDSITTVVSDTMLAVLARPGGPSLPALDVMDASPVEDAAPSPSTISPGGGVASPAAIPGGISAAELPDIFRQADLTPMVMFLSLAAAAALGAGHALTPGHGKTLMAAYLVGTRGSTRHAIGLGAAVSVSHTAGILALAAIIVTATDVVAPDVVVRWSPVVAAISILLIGVWMLLGEVRRRRAGPASLAQDRSHDHDHHGPHPHDHPHDHGHDHPHGPIPTTITWRSLFLLGLAGGLIPSTSALLILLGSIATGRPAFGLVLVVAFGLGMAAVMSGLGLVVVTARDRFDRVGGGVGLTRVRSAMPLIASVVVVGFGIVLTAQALSAVRVL
jgi:ABC-type nickel/cobalt efflux system permease component RcnA